MQSLVNPKVRMSQVNDMSSASATFGFVDRVEEMNRILDALKIARTGKGQLLIVRGEAGSGKTRLVQEAATEAEKLGFSVGFGTALAESVVPYHAWKEVLEGLGLETILEEPPPPKLLGLYLLDPEGRIQTKVEREDIDSDLLSNLASTLADSVDDSKGQDEAVEGGFTILPHDGQRLLLHRGSTSHLGAIVEGREDEAFLADMMALADKAESIFRGEDIQHEGEEPDQVIEAQMRQLLDSEIYEGIDYAKEDPKLRQNRLFEHVTLGLSRKAGDHPMCVVIDDLQWADSSSLALLQYVSRNTRRSGILLLGTYRIEEAEARPHLKKALEGMQQEELLDEMDSKGLSRKDLPDLAESFVGVHDLQDDFLDLLWWETQGNPLFVREVLKGLEEEGAIAIHGAVKCLVRPLDQLAIPERVREVIRTRLNRLPEEDRRLLDAAATCGTRFTAALVAKVAGEEEIEVLNGLSAIAKVHGLLRPADSSFTFDHPAVQEVTYEVIPENIRRAYHLEAAKWLELVGGSIEEAAEHYYRAHDSRAGQKLWEAAESARARYANEEAIRFYDEALELVKDKDERVRILDVLGDACELVGAYDRSIKVHRDLLSLLGDGRSTARIRMKIARAFEKKGAHTESIATLEEAFAGLGDADSSDVAMIQAQLGHVYMLRGEYDTALRHLNRSLELSRRLNDRKGVAMALCAIGEIRWVRSELDMALPPLLESLDIRERDGPLKELCETRDIIGFVYLDRGECRQALEHLHKSLADVVRVGDTFRIASSYHSIGVAHLALDKVDLAMEFFEKSLRIGKRAGLAWGIAFNLNFMGLAHLKKGDHGRALAALEQSLKIREGIGDRWGVSYTCWALGEAYCAQRAWDRARECCGQALDLARQFGFRRQEAGTHRVLGMISRGQGKWSEAIENFEESLRIFHDIGMRLEEAMSHYEFGLMWKAKGDSHKATKHLKKAEQAFRRLGLNLKVEHITHVLADIGNTP